MKVDSTWIAVNNRRDHFDVGFHLYPSLMSVKVDVERSTEARTEVRVLY